MEAHPETQKWRNNPIAVRGGGHTQYPAGRSVSHIHTDSARQRGICWWHRQHQTDGGGHLGGVYALALRGWRRTGNDTHGDSYRYTQK